MYNNEQLVALAQQCKQEGGDLDALISTLQAMEAGGKTSLGLNQWSSTDKPDRGDFNDAFAEIDQALV